MVMPCSYTYTAISWKLRCDCVVEWTVCDVLEDCSAFISSVKQWKSSPLKCLKHS